MFRIPFKRIEENIMSTLKKVVTRLFWSENQHDVVLTADNDATFNINLDKLLVGTLLYSGGMWQFSYSDEFKNQNRILPLANFPTKDKEYSACELWPFFASRIPSNAQLQIEKDKPQENYVTLLQRFGRRTVANPYELKPVL